MLGPQVDPKNEVPASPPDINNKQAIIIKGLQAKVMEQEILYKSILQKYLHCKEEKESQLQKLQKMILEQVIRQGRQVQHYEEKIQRLTKCNKELQINLNEAIRISDQKSSSLGQAKLRERQFLRKLNLMQEELMKRQQEHETERNTLLKQNRLMNERLLQLVAEKNLILTQRNDAEINRLKIILQQVDWQNRGTPVLPQMRLTPQEEELSSVIFGEPRPTISANEFTCHHSCVVLSLSFVCRESNVHVCPLCVVKIATHIAGGHLGFDNSIIFNCEKTIDLFISSNLLWHVKSEGNICNIKTLNKAIIDVTNHCQDDVGLIAFEYHHQSIGHCLVFVKVAKRLKIYDPQKCDWWHEEDYNYYYYYYYRLLLL